MRGENRHEMGEEGGDRRKGGVRVKVKRSKEGDEGARGRKD